VKCQYVDYDRDRAIREFTALTEGKEAPVLKECITCVACNEYCPTGANPYDLIMRLQEETGALVIPEKTRAFLDRGMEVPNEVIKGDHDKAVLSVCIAGPLLSEGVLESKMFEGLTIVKGADYWCYVVYLHAALESVVKANVHRFFDNLAKLGAREIIFLHDECYAMANRIAADYGVKPSFKPELASKVQDMNLADTQEHGAEAMAFICPWCQLALRKGCEERGLPKYI